jgi:DEAD/DEAH box helicase domain-containing protein
MMCCAVLWCVQATPLLPELLQRALDLVLGCPCTYPKGCPRCVQHLDCKNYNAVLSKKAAVHVLKAAIEQEAAYMRRSQQQQQ